jgi:hypothetical protein
MFEPIDEAKVRRRNIMVGSALGGFVVGVFLYTINQLKKVRVRSH